MPMLTSLGMGCIYRAFWFWWYQSSWGWPAFQWHPPQHSSEWWSTCWGLVCLWRRHWPDSGGWSCNHRVLHKLKSTWLRVEMKVFKDDDCVSPFLPKCFKLRSHSIKNVVPLDFNEHVPIWPRMFVIKAKRMHHFMLNVADQVHTFPQINDLKSQVKFDRKSWSLEQQYLVNWKRPISSSDFGKTGARVFKLDVNRLCRWEQELISTIRRHLCTHTSSALCFQVKHPSNILL